LTAVLSISSSAGGQPAKASSWNTSIHTPLLAQRTGLQDTDDLADLPATIDAWRPAQFVRKQR